MKDILKIGYFADGPWSHESFKLLIADKSIKFAFICVRFDTKDDTLKNYCKEYKIDYLKHENINSLEFRKKLEEYKCDLFVSMSFNQIFQKSLIDSTPLGIINCHAGKLPFYRGRNVLNWVLINDESEFGITVHFVDEGIDTGDIIMQKSFPINDEDTYETLLNKAYVECSKLLYSSIDAIRKGKYDRIPQKNIHPVGMYCGARQVGDEFIDWNQTSREIFNFIRAISKPGPMGRSFINGSEIRINKVSMIENSPHYKGINGQVIGITKRGFLVKTLDSFIEVLEYDYNGKIGIGNRLKSNK